MTQPQAQQQNVDAKTTRRRIYQSRALLDDDIFEESLNVPDDISDVVRDLNLDNEFLHED